MTVNAHSCLKMYGAECLLGTQIEDDEKRCERKKKSNVYTKQIRKKPRMIYISIVTDIFINILLFVLSICYE